MKLLAIGPHEMFTTPVLTGSLDEVQAAQGCQHEFVAEGAMTAGEEYTYPGWSMQTERCRLCRCATRVHMYPPPKDPNHDQEIAFPARDYPE